MTAAGVGLEVAVPSSMMAVADSGAGLLPLERRGPARPRSRWSMAATLAALPPRLLSLFGFSTSPAVALSVFPTFDSLSLPEADILLPSLLKPPNPDPSRFNIVAVSISTALTACLMAFSSLSISSLSFPLALILSIFLLSDRLEDEEAASFPSFGDFDLLPPGAAFSAAAVAFCCLRKSMSGVLFGFSGFSPEGNGTESGSFGRAEPEGEAVIAPTAPSADGVVPSAGAAPLDVGTVPTPLIDARNATKSGSLSIVPALVSTRPPFLGNFWKGEYSTWGYEILPLESMNGPWERKASFRVVI